MSRVESVYLVHHSHTDIGYTHDQPIVWDLHTRFIDEAVKLAQKYAESESAGAFRWTVETTRVLSRWLEQASDRQIEQFLALERAGRVEVTAMFANVTPLYDTDQLLETFQLLRPLRDTYGLTIRHAMNCDVNGENWPLVDLLLDLGIEGFTMAINQHFGGAPLCRPNAFWWEGPSGRKLLAWNGWPYSTGLRYGIGRDEEEFENTWWPRIERHLDEIDYPLPILMVQSYHPFGDNGSAYEEFSRFIDRWNEQGKSPRLKLATPSDWWSAVKEHAASLPTYRGDWTDYWNFGCISSAREQGINRMSRLRLRTADSLAGVVLSALQKEERSGSQSQTERSFARYRDAAWDALHLWDEHTWGADCSLRAPANEDTLSQWYHKANYAYTARSLSLLLQRDAVADLAAKVTRASSEDLFLFNPLPWARVMSGPVNRGVVAPRGVSEDVTAGRHFQDRVRDEEAYPWIKGLEINQEIKDPPGAFLLQPTEVPGFGYAVVPRSEIKNAWDDVHVSEDAVIENERCKVTFDRERGGILSWIDKTMEHEWVDQAAPYRFNGFVHERVADTQHSWPRGLLFDASHFTSHEVEPARGWKPDWRATRECAGEVIEHRVYRTPHGQRIVQRLKAPGCVGLLTQLVFLPHFADYIECESWWDMGLEDHPEATYILYPFDVPQGVARLDLGGQAIRADDDQIPGACRDYFTVQNWVDFSNEDLGVSVATPENPMVQLGDFHFGHNQRRVSLERSMLLGWVTNNYWETNFRAHQPGRVHARYRILPHGSGFDEAQAHRFGLEAAVARPVVQRLGERAQQTPMPSVLPASGSLVELPGGPIQTLHIKPERNSSEALEAKEQTSDHRSDGAEMNGTAIIVRLLNASDTDQRAEIKSGVLRVVGASACDLLERLVEDIPVQNGAVSLTLPPRRVRVVRIEVS